MPDPEQRNTLVRQQWEKHRGLLPEEELARKKFGDDRYSQHRDVCVFAEHAAVDGQGKNRQYDLAEMVRICRACNFRIRDFDGFAPISDGHTPDEPGLPEPDILGYAGPFRLGMVGREKPRWAIFCDEWHAKDQAERLASKPRRSVELWTFKSDPTRTHFDPIAAIGSETPRLALPVKFRRQKKDGALVERYTFSAPSSGVPSLPGGGNTHVLKFEEKQPMLANEELAQIMSAFMETPQMQFLDQLMQQHQSTHGDQEAEPDPMGDDRGNGNHNNYEDETPPAEPEIVEDLADESEPTGTEDIADLSDLLVPEEDEEEDPMKAMRQRHSRRSAQPKHQGNGQAADSEPSQSVKYSRLKTAHNKLVEDHGRLAKAFEASQRNATDAERAAAVHQLAAEYPDFVDVATELDTVLYSRNANMSDEAFEKHVSTVEKYAQRADMHARASRPDLPLGEVDRGRGDRQQNEKYAAKLAQETVRIYTKAINSGRDCTYDDARAEAEKAMQPSA